MRAAIARQAVDLTAATTYEIAENDFMASGGDGYPFFTPRVTTQDIMDQVLADHITASSPVSPSSLLRRTDASTAPIRMERQHQLPSARTLAVSTSE